MEATDRKAAISAWQRRLRKTFAGPHGQCGERSLIIAHAESAHQHLAAHEFTGFMTLMDAFQDFVLEVVGEAKPEQIRAAGMKWAMLAASFQRLRSALNACYQGYYFDAASNLRGIVENVFYIGAALNGYIADWDIFNVSGVDFQRDSEEAIDRIAEKHRRTMERKIQTLMYGKDSGISESHQIAIRRFLKLLHLHVHRTQSSLIYSFERWRRDHLPPSFLPVFNSKEANIFASAAAITAWCFVRCIVSCLTLRTLPDSVQQKFEILDDSFKFYVESSQSSVSEAMMELTSKKFPLVATAPQPVTPEC